MQELTLIGSQNKSKILISNGMIQHTAKHCLSHINQNNMNSLKVCIITDTNVEPLYFHDVSNSFIMMDVAVYKHVIEAGEEHKTLKTVSDIYDTLSNEGFGRNDMIVALGGGVVGDIAGYAAATFLRGMKYLIQIPTTLLAQVDSSVGRKCGVDLPQGKNLVGAFRQPNIVIIDTDVLKTLTSEIYASGMAEIIKYGCIWDPVILDFVASENFKENIEATISKCVKIKIQVVQEDETETGLRKILNFGHTIGHSIEKLGNFTEYSHGEAVAIGMSAAVMIGENAGITKKGCYNKLIDLLKLVGLPTKINYKIDSVYESMLSDKKKQGNHISFIYIEDFGKVKIMEHSLQELRDRIDVLGED